MELANLGVGGIDLEVDSYVHLGQELNMGQISNQRVPAEGMSGGVNSIAPSSMHEAGRAVLFSSILLC